MGTERDNEVLPLGGGSYSRHDGSHITRALNEGGGKLYVSTYGSDGSFDATMRQAAREGRAEYFIGQTNARGRDSHTFADGSFGRGVSGYRSGEGRVVGGEGTVTGPRQLGQYAHAKIASRESGSAYVSSGSNTRGETSFLGMNNTVRELRGQPAREAHQVNLVMMGRANPSTVANNKNVLLVGPQGDTARFRNQLLGAIRGAQSEVIVTSPNLSDPRVMAELKAAAQRGVHVMVGYNRTDLGDNPYGRARQAAEKLKALPGASVYEYQNLGIINYGHSNFLGVDGGKYTAGGSVRFNRSFLDGEVTDAVMVGKDQEGYQFFKREIMKGVKQAASKAGLQLPQNTGFEGMGLGLERFMPNKHSQNVAYAASIDPRAMIDASTMYLSNIKHYHRLAVRGDAAARILEDRWQKLYTKFRNEPGAFSALYTMLTHDHTGVRPDISEIPWLVANADRAMKTATIGQDSLMFNAIGGQVGQRGFLGSGLINFSRSADNALGTHQGDGGPGGFQSFTTGGIDLMTSMVGNAVMFQFAALPLMRLASKARSSTGPAFERAAAVLGAEAGGQKVSKFFGRIVEAGDTLVSGIGIRLMDNLIAPIADVLGVHAQAMVTDARSALANQRKNLPEAMVKSYQAVDARMAASPVTQALSTKGFGMLYDMVLNPGKLWSYAGTGLSNIKTLMGIDGRKAALKELRLELDMAKADVADNFHLLGAATGDRLNQAFSKAGLTKTFDTSAFDAHNNQTKELVGIGINKGIVGSLQKEEAEVFRLRQEVAEMRQSGRSSSVKHTGSHSPGSDRGADMLEAMLTKAEDALFNRYDHIAGEINKRGGIGKTTAEGNRQFEELQAKITDDKARLGLMPEDDVARQPLFDNIVSMERARDNIPRFSAKSLRENFDARSHAARQVADQGSNLVKGISPYKGYGIGEAVRKAMDFEGGLIKGVAGRPMSAFFLIVGAAVGFDMLTSSIASASRLTLWEQLGAAYSVNSQATAVESSRQRLQVDYQAGFGRMGDVFYNATGGIPVISHLAAAAGHTISLASFAVQKVASPFVRLGQYATHFWDTVATKTATSGQMAELLGAYVSGNAYGVADRIRKSGQLTESDQKLLQMLGTKDPRVIDKVAGDIFSRVQRDSDANAGQLSATKLSMYGMQFAMGSANLAAITLGASRFRDETYFGISIQAPVVFQLGMNVQLPIGLAHWTDPKTQEEHSYLSYVPGSSAELAFWTGVQLKGYAAALQGANWLARKVISSLDPNGENSHFITLLDDFTGSTAARAVKGSYSAVDRSLGFFAHTPLRAFEAIASGTLRTMREFHSNRIFSELYVVHDSVAPGSPEEAPTRLSEHLTHQKPDIAAIEGRSAFNHIVADNVTAEYMKALPDQKSDVTTKELVKNLGVRSDKWTGRAASRAIWFLTGSAGVDRVIKNAEGVNESFKMYDAREVSTALGNVFTTAHWMPSFGAHQELNKQLALHGGDITKLDKRMQEYANRRVVKVLNAMSRVGVGGIAAAGMAVVGGTAAVLGAARFENIAERYAEFTQSHWLLRPLAAPLYLFGLGGNVDRAAANSQEHREIGKRIWGAASLHSKTTVNDARQVLYGGFVGKLQALWKTNPVYAGTTSGYAGTGGFGFAIDPVKGSVVDPRTGNEFVLAGPFMQGTGILNAVGNLAQFTYSDGFRSATYTNRSAAEYGLGLAASADIMTMLSAHRVSPRGKRATIGAMWHEASGNSTLGMAGKMELRRREAMTSWVLANNNAADVFNYFYRDRNRDKNLFAKTFANSTGTFSFGSFFGGTSGRSVSAAIQYAQGSAMTNTGMPEAFISYDQAGADYGLNRRRGLSVEELTKGKDGGIASPTAYGMMLTLGSLGGVATLLAGVALAPKLRKMGQMDAFDERNERSSNAAATAEVQDLTKNFSVDPLSKAQLIESALEAGMSPEEAEDFASKREAGQPPKPRGGLFGKLWGAATRPEAKSLLSQAATILKAGVTTSWTALGSRKDGESFHDSLIRETRNDVVRSIFSSPENVGFEFAAVEPTGLGVNIKSVAGYDGSLGQHPGHSFWVVKNGNDLLTFGGMGLQGQAGINGEQFGGDFKGVNLLPKGQLDKKLLGALESLNFDSRTSLADAPIGNLNDELLGIRKDGVDVVAGRDASGRIKLDAVDFGALSSGSSDNTVISRALYRARDVKTVQDALRRVQTDSASLVQKGQAIAHHIQTEIDHTTGRLVNAAGDKTASAQIQKQLDLLQGRQGMVNAAVEAHRGRIGGANQLASTVFAESGPMQTLAEMQLSLADELNKSVGRAKVALDGKHTAADIEAFVIKDMGNTTSGLDSMVLKLNEMASGLQQTGIIDTTHQLEYGKSGNVLHLMEDMNKMQQMVSRATLTGTGSFGGPAERIINWLGYSRPENLEGLVMDLGGGSKSLHGMNAWDSLLHVLTFGGTTQVGKDMAAWRQAKEAKLAQGLSEDVMASFKIEDGETAEAQRTKMGDSIGFSARNILNSIARGVVSTSDANFDSFVTNSLQGSLDDGNVSPEAVSTLADIMRQDTQHRIAGHNRAMANFSINAIARGTGLAIKYGAKTLFGGAMGAAGLLSIAKSNSSYYTLGALARGVGNHAVTGDYAHGLAKDVFIDAVGTSGENALNASGAVLAAGGNWITEWGVGRYNKFSKWTGGSAVFSVDTMGPDSNVVAGDRITGAPDRAAATRWWVGESEGSFRNASGKLSVASVFGRTGSLLAGAGGALKATGVGLGIGAGVGLGAGLLAGAMGADRKAATFLGAQAGMATAAIIGGVQGLLAVTTAVKAASNAAAAAEGVGLVAAGMAAGSALLPLAVGIGLTMGVGWLIDQGLRKVVEPYLIENQDEIASGISNFVSQDGWKGSAIRALPTFGFMLYSQVQRVVDGTLGRWAKGGRTENDSTFDKFLGAAASGVYSLFSVIGGKAMDHHDPERTWGSSPSLDASKWQMPFMRDQAAGKGSAFFASKMTPFFYGNRHDLVDSLFRQQQSMLEESPEAIAQGWLSEDHSGRIPDAMDSHMTNAPGRQGSFFRRSFSGLSTLGEASQEMLAVRGQATGFALASLDGRLWGDKDNEATIPLDSKHAWHNAPASGFAAEVMRRTTAVVSVWPTLGRLWSRWMGSAPTGPRAARPSRMTGGSGRDYANVTPLSGDHLAVHQILPGGVITSGFGHRHAPKAGASTEHHGVDLATGRRGDPLFAAFGGTVRTAGWVGGYGNTVIVDDGHGHSFLLGHMDRLTVRAGDRISAGQQVGNLGNTGVSTGPHTHFEIMANGRYVDPVSYLGGRARRGAGGRGGPVEEVDHHDHHARQASPNRPVGAPNLSTLQGRLQAVVAGSDVGALRAGDIRQLSPSQFAHAIKRGAEDVERRYGVPALVTMAQAALESGWGKHAIGGYNIFGIKGRGSGGSANVRTWEHVNGRDVTVNDNFAVYRNFSEAFDARGRLFHNGLYNQAVADYRKTRNPYRFLSLISRIYATDPNYQTKVAQMMKQIETMTGKPVNIDITVGPAPTGMNSSDPGKPRVGPQSIQLSRRRANFMATATYPDGTPYLSLLDPAMEPIEMQLIDPYAGGSQ